MKHVLWKKGDAGLPASLTDRNGDVVLAKCKTCGRAEVELEISPNCSGDLLKMAQPPNAADILREAAETFEGRNAVYGNNYLNVGNVMVALFPNGVVLKTVDDFLRWHLFELKIVKITRFANSGLTHQDSIRDDTVYGAMVESLISSNTKPITGGNTNE